MRRLRDRWTACSFRIPKFEAGSVFRLAGQRLSRLAGAVLDGARSEPQSRGPIDRATGRLPAAPVSSIGVLAGCVDDRLPAGDLALHLVLERRGCGVRFRRGFRAKLSETGDDIGMLQGQLQ